MDDERGLVMLRMMTVFCAVGMVGLGISSASAVSQELPGQLIVPTGTKLELAVTRAVWAAKVKAGDRLYAETVFPVAVDGTMAIPAGSYVEGEIESVKAPTRKDNHAEFHLRFGKIIYANGYVAELGAGQLATGAVVTVQVSRVSDILLDNGTQMEINLGSALALDGQQVMAAVAVARALRPGEFARATLCRPSVGSPGSDGITVPGTPATPPTVIPGGPGMPDTVIPGTPGTPSQVVGQMAGTPGTVCPAPPVVISSVPEQAGLVQNK